MSGSTSFTYAQSGADATSGNGTVSAAAPLVTIYLDHDTRGVAINSETEVAVLADPSSASLTFMSLLDQSVQTLALETGMVAAAVNPLTNTAVATNSSGNTVSVIDLKTFSLGDTADQPARTATLPVPGTPVAIAIDPVANLAITANQKNGTVSILDLGSLRPLQVVQISPFSSLTSTTPVTLTLLGNGFAAGSVVRFNETALGTTYVSDRKLTATVPACIARRSCALCSRRVEHRWHPIEREYLYGDAGDRVGTSPRGVTIDRGRRLAVVTNSGSHNLSIFNLDSLATVGTIRVGTSPQGVALSSVAGRAVVTNTEDDTVSVIDLDNIAVSSTVSVAPSSGTAKPIGIAVHPGSGLVIVADSNESEVSFFNISSPGTPTTLAVDAGPNAVAIDPVRNLAAVSETTSGQDCVRRSLHFANSGSGQRLLAADRSGLRS